MLAQGGMTPMEALRCGTLNGARYLGLDWDVGSLEPGKLADLVVLDKNPLDDIRHTDSIRWVMANGRLYDGIRLDEIGNHPRRRPPLYFERVGAEGGDVIHAEEEETPCSAERRSD
jgi:adenine deaminase